MELKALKEIGLTEGETKVYLTLTKLGQVKTGIISKEAGVSSSKVYKILDRLEKKGLVGHALIGKVKHFTATEPSRLLDYVDDRQKELDKKKKTIEDLIPQLELSRKENSQKTETTVYDGIAGIKHLFLNMLDELNNGEEYYVMNADYGNDPKGLREWFQKFHTMRAEKNVKVNMLASYKTKGNLVSATQVKSKVRYLPEEMFSKLDIVFYKDKSFIFFFTEDPKGILIKNKEITDGYKIYFDTFWKMAKSE